MPYPQLSVMLINFSASDPGNWKPLLDGARAADQAGIDRLAVSDHVVFGENLEAYGDARVGGIEGGKQPTGPDGMWLEPLTLLSVLAGVTTQTCLATGILQAALRRPAVLAKAVATLDVLSGGRLDLGVGVDGSGRSTTPPASASRAGVIRPPDPGRLPGLVARGAGGL